MLFATDQFDLDQQECEFQARQLQRLIVERGQKWIEAIEQQKHFYFDFIEKNRHDENLFGFFDEMLAEFELIDQCVSESSKFADLNEIFDKIDQIEHRFETFAENFDQNDLKVK